MGPVFKLFRNKRTGKSDYFPPHFADFPDFEEVDPDTETCIDCVFVPEDFEPVEVEDEIDTDWPEPDTYQKSEDY